MAGCRTSSKFIFLQSHCVRWGSFLNDASEVLLDILQCLRQFSGTSLLLPPRLAGKSAAGGIFLCVVDVCRVL